jgi:hypothetical protein
LPVLYGYGTWSLTLKEGYRLRVIENKMLRKVFEPQRGKVRVYWIKLNTEELHISYCSPYFIRVIKLRQMKLAGNVARTGGKEKRNILLGKPEGDIHLEDQSVDVTIMLN